MMVHIVENAEQHLDYDKLLSQAGDNLKSSVSTAIGYSSVLAAEKLKGKMYHYAFCVRCNDTLCVKYETQAGYPWNYA